MQLKEFDTVVLNRDLPEHGLRQGDLGAVVFLHGDQAMEVEFADSSGFTRALLTLYPSDVRKAREEELRSLASSAESIRTESLDKKSDEKYEKGKPRVFTAEFFFLFLIFFSAYKLWTDPSSTPQQETFRRALLAVGIIGLIPIGIFRRRKA